MTGRAHIGRLHAATWMLLLATVLSGTVFLEGGHAGGQPLGAGSGSFVFDFSKGGPGTTITVWYHRPPDLEEDARIVFVMHGVDRNGRDYRDSWVTHSESGRFLLLVPEFSAVHFPGGWGYNLGNMFSKDGKAIPEPQWAFTAIEEIFEHVRVENGLENDRYLLYGHSAGAQFVHRLVLFKPEARVELAIAANAGWYTFPRFDVDFPFGLKGSGMSSESLSKSFSRKLVVLLGEEDTDPDHKHLTKTEGAMEQGEHRLERGESFFDAAATAAAAIGTPFNWEYDTVRGVGHSNSNMSKPAAGYISDYL